MNFRMNKKGAEGDFRNIMVGGALALVVLGLVLFFLIGGSQQVKNLTQILPEDRNRVIGICENIIFDTNDNDEYCNVIKQVESNLFVTCSYYAEIGAMEAKEGVFCDLNKRNGRIIEQISGAPENGFDFSKAYTINNERVDLYVPGFGTVRQQVVDVPNKELVDAVVAAEAKVAAEDNTENQAELAAARDALTAAS